MLALLVLGIVTYRVFWRTDPQLNDRLERQRVGIYALRNADVVSDEAFGYIFDDVGVVRQEIPILRAHRYSLYYNTSPDRVPPRYDGETAGCNIDNVNGRPVAMIEIHRLNERGMRVEGWAVDSVAGQASTQVFVGVDRRIDFPALTGNQRPDVASFFHNPNYETAGFTAYIRSSLIPDGEHILNLKIVNHDGSGYRACGSWHIAVTE